VPGYADQLQGDDRRILQLRPGITGPASIKYRNEEELLAQQADPKWYNDNVIYPDKIRLNCYYFRHYSFIKDIQMIFCTVLGKNLLNAIKFFRGIKGSATFDIYGPKEDESYWKECEEAIKGLPVNIVVNYKGVLSHDEIHRTFCQYDAFLFPTQSENYGHVIVEALVTNCVPIIRDQTPWTDMNGALAG
jgi:hypothetical protein